MPGLHGRPVERDRILRASHLARIVVWMSSALGWATVPQRITWKSYFLHQRQACTCTHACICAQKHKCPYTWKHARTHAHTHTFICLLTLIFKRHNIDISFLRRLSECPSCHCVGVGGWAGVMVSVPVTLSAWVSCFMAFYSCGGSKR